MIFEHADRTVLHEAARLTARKWGSSVSFTFFSNKTRIEVVSTLPMQAHEAAMFDYFRTMLENVYTMNKESHDVPTI